MFAELLWHIWPLQVQCLFNINCFYRFFNKIYRNEMKKIIVSLTEIDKNLCTKELTVIKKLKIFDENKHFDVYESNFLITITI